MSADTDPFERVWFPRSDAIEEPTAHASAACATRGRDDEAIPSFRAFAEAIDARTCGVCTEHHLVTSDPTPTPEEIRTLRESLGETQAEFAERLGFAESTVACWESQGVPPSPVAVARLGAIEAADDDGTDDAGSEVETQAPSDAVLRDLARAEATVVGLAQAHDGLTIATATQANRRLGLGLEEPQGYGRQHARRGESA